MMATDNICCVSVEELPDGNIIAHYIYNSFLGVVLISCAANSGWQFAVCVGLFVEIEFMLVVPLKLSAVFVFYSWKTKLLEDVVTK